MPIAKIQLPDGRIGRFEVAEGTTPDQVLEFANNQFGGQEQQMQQQAGMQQMKEEGANYRKEAEIQGKMAQGAMDQGMMDQGMMQDGNAEQMPQNSEMQQ